MQINKEKMLAKVQQKFVVRKTSQVMDLLYDGVDARRLSLDERARLNIKEDVFVYGEILYPTFALMLELADAKPGEVFYDLGSGSGKAVIFTNLLYDMKKCVGVEYLEPLYAVSKEKLAALPNLTEYKSLNKSQLNVEFYNEDLYPFDVSDADIIYMNATCFVGEKWDQAMAKFDQLKSGTRFILTTKTLPGDKYHSIFSELMPMSWGTCTLSVFRKL